MEIMTDYADLVRKINIFKTQLELVEGELSYWFGAGDVVPFVGRGTLKFGMSAAVDHVEELHSKKHKLVRMIEFYEEIEREIRESIEALEGLQYQIARMRFIEGYNYREIADRLGYSYDHIRRVASRSHNRATAISKDA